MMNKYPCRKTEVINGVRIDTKAYTEEELGKKHSLKIDKILRGEITTGGSTPVNRWVEKYFEVYVDEKVSSGVASDRRSLYKNHIKKHIGAMKISEVNAGHCQKIINGMRGYSKDRIDKTCQLMFNIFRKAKTEKLIFENPAEDLSRPPAEDNEGRPATLQERAYMLMVGKNHRAGLWIKTMFVCGFRPGETDRFKGKHINYTAGLVFIDGTKSAAAKRIVPAPSELLDEFKKLNRQPEEYIFQNSYGYQMRKSSRAKLWNNFKCKMNLRAGCKMEDGEIIEPVIAKDLIPYCCRHSFATDLKDANISFRIRQELLGHSNGSVTDTYTHRTETSLKIASALLKKYRLEQDEEILQMQKRILKEGYKAEMNVTENLTHKYFPEL